MVQLSDSLSVYVRRELKINDVNKTTFTEKELASISYASMSKDDMDVIKYFRNLSVLSLEHYPSLNDDDLKYIGEKIPSIISLKIKEQNLMTDIDLSSFNNLIELALIHNDNLVNIRGLNNVRRLTFYDNKEFKNIKQIVDYLNKIPDCMATIDFLYYMDFKRSSIKEEVFNNIFWVESLGLRSYSVHEYSPNEIKFVMDYISNIVSKYIYVNDTPLEKFSILYRWMIDNIKFINEDEKGSMNSVNYNNTYKVLNTRCGGRLSLPKTFQMFLTYTGINSYVVYSYGTLDSIGFSEGQKVFSLLGNSDYSLLRIELDNKYYYSDINWDSAIDNYNYAEVLRLFLVSKKELSSRHKFVGEGSINDSYSCSNEEIEKLLILGKDRIQEVDNLFWEIDRMDNLIINAEIEKNILQSIIMTKESNNSFKYEGEKDGLLLSIDSVELRKKDYLSKKEQIIKNNSKELIENYIGDAGNIKEYLNTLRKSYSISNALFDILSRL